MSVSLPESLVQQMDGLTKERGFAGRSDFVRAAVRDFITREVQPVASALEHADAYPHVLVARMKALGLFGALVPRAYGGLGLDVTTYARVIEEICRGWMSLAGVLLVLLAHIGVYLVGQLMAVVP